MEKEEKQLQVRRRLIIEPLTLANWNKFIELFGEKGAADGCWCMYYRTVNKEYKEGRKDGSNKRKMHALVSGGKQVGLLGILDGKAVGWCALSPREDFVRIEKSRTHKRTDDEPVWSVPCFYTDKKYRGTGVSEEMLKGVIKYARENNIKILEAYPVVPLNGKIPNSSAWYGIYNSFEKAGFEVASTKLPNRPMMRYYVHKHYTE